MYFTTVRSVRLLWYINFPFQHREFSFYTKRNLLPPGEEKKLSAWIESGDSTDITSCSKFKVGLCDAQRIVKKSDFWIGVLKKFVRFKILKITPVQCLQHFTIKLVSFIRLYQTNYPNEKAHARRTL